MSGVITPPDRSIASPLEVFGVFVRKGWTLTRLCNNTILLLALVSLDPHRQRHHPWWVSNHPHSQSTCVHSPNPILSISQSVSQSLSHNLKERKMIFLCKYEKFPQLFYSFLIFFTFPQCISIYVYCMTSFSSHSMRQSRI